MFSSTFAWCLSGRLPPYSAPIWRVAPGVRATMVVPFLAVALIPTVSPATNSLVYFISIASIDHPVWRSPREEAKRGPPSGHRITRNGAAMVSLLLPYATTGLSRIAGWCWSGATPRGPPRTPVLCPFRRPFMGRPVPRPFLRNAWLNLTTIVPTTASHRRSYAERYSRSIGKPCGT
jgi:hypothetical protein